MQDEEGGIYYAQIKGLLTDQYCDKSAVVTWLLPTQESPPPEERFDPATYIIGKLCYFLWWFLILIYSLYFRPRRGYSTKIRKYGIYNACPLRLLQVKEYTLSNGSRPCSTWLHMDIFRYNKKVLYVLKEWNSYVQMVFYLCLKQFKFFKIFLNFFFGIWLRNQASGNIFRLLNP